MLIFLFKQKCVGIFLGLLALPASVPYFMFNVCLCYILNQFWVLSVKVVCNVLHI